MRDKAETQVRGNEKQLYSQKLISNLKKMEVLKNLSLWLDRSKQ